MKKIGILLNSSSEFLPQARYSAPNKLEYCLRWGYEFYFHWIDLSSSISISNQRMTSILETLERCDWVWFLGADTLIMNMTIDINHFLDDKYDFIIAKDINGLNNDSCFYQNTLATFEFLYKIIELNETLQHDGFSQPEAIKQLPNLRVKVEDQKLFNSYLYHTDPTYDFYLKHIPEEKHPKGFSIGDFVLHFPGMDNKHREQLMEKYSQMVIR
jgi:hypothetical protein